MQTSQSSKISFRLQGQKWLVAPVIYLLLPLLPCLAFAAITTAVPVKMSGSSPVEAAKEIPNAGGSKSAPAKDAALPTPPPSVISITKVVGEVGDQIVTSREVRINDGIEQALSQKLPGTDGFRILTGQEKSFPGEVSRVLDEWVIYLEAKSFSNTPPPRVDVAKTLKAVQDLWASSASWQRLEASSEELRAIIERKLVAREFQRLKADSSLVPVSDADAQAYYKKNRLRFGSLPFESFKENIKTFLIKQQTERRLAEWHEVLRRKYKVRNFIAG